MIEKFEGEKAPAETPDSKSFDFWPALARGRAPSGERREEHAAGISGREDQVDGDGGPVAEHQRTCILEDVIDSSRGTRPLTIADPANGESGGRKHVSKRVSGLPRRSNRVSKVASRGSRGKSGGRAVVRIPWGLFPPFRATLRRDRWRPPRTRSRSRRRRPSRSPEFMAAELVDECGVLRIAVQGGGCSGFQYALGFDEGPAGRRRDHRHARRQAGRRPVQLCLYLRRRRRRLRGRPGPAPGSRSRTRMLLPAAPAAPPSR